MSYTPEQLREDADTLERERRIVEEVDTTWLIELYRAYADALETIAKLKAHAEAMAVAIEHSQGYVNAAKAYRRHFPRDEK